MTVAARITALWPDTEAALLASTTAGYAAARARAMDDGVALLYGTYAPGANVPTIADIESAPSLALLEQHLAELAVLQLVPMARDHYAKEARRRSLELADGVSGTVEGYDRFKALDDLQAALRASLAGRSALVASLVRASMEPPATRAVPPLFTLAQGRRGL
jgi:hypothetical protein